MKTYCRNRKWNIFESECSFDHPLLFQRNSQNFFLILNFKMKLANEDSEKHLIFLQSQLSRTQKFKKEIFFRFKASLSQETCCARSSIVNKVHSSNQSKT